MTAPSDPSSPIDPIRRLIAGEVRALFNDRAGGEKPVERRPDGLFGPRSVAWRVHGDVVSMLAGGLAGLLLQMLLPEVLAGVWDHSNFRADMHGRLRRTARFIARTTYGGRDEALDAIARVRRIHERVEGSLPDGTPYRANDPLSLAWVHVTETTSFLASFIRYVEPAMPPCDRDRYFAEMAVVGEALGATPVPRTGREAAALIARMRPQLRADARTRTVARLVLDRPPASPALRPMQHLTRAAAIDLLPPWAGAMHGLRRPTVTAPAVRIGTAGLAGIIRWAMA